MRSNIPLGFTSSAGIRHQQNHPARAGEGPWQVIPWLDKIRGRMTAEPLYLTPVHCRPQPQVLLPHWPRQDHGGVQTRGVWQSQLNLRGAPGPPQLLSSGCQLLQATPIHQQNQPEIHSKAQSSKASAGLQLYLNRFVFLK